MKKFRFAAALLFLIGVAIFLLFNLTAPVPPAPAVAYGTNGTNRTNGTAPIFNSNTATEPNSAAATNTTANDLSTRAGEYVPKSDSTETVSPEIVVQKIRRAVHQYGDMFDGNPVGTNPEITAALGGENPKHINFFSDLPGININSDGELLDPWGTPYFFHQLSATDMEIHSAGPDKKMWTSDDVVAR